MAYNNTQSRNRDPLRVLPSELVLRILDFASPESLARLTSLNTAWHAFIDKTHQDRIYCTKTSHPHGSKDFSWLQESTSYSKWLHPDHIASWKDLCRRQTLLDRNWQSSQPKLQESIIQIGDIPIWRFKPDFKRRLILSTSQAGAFKVTDMDSGELLWTLDAVRPFAHLEYQDGTAVWDSEGNSLEVWRTDLEGTSRGEFRQVATLPHESTTRGFQLSFGTLCVVSSDGEGFVYEDMITGTPTLKTHIDLDLGAVGHLDQCSDVVAYSFGPKGYHFYEKDTGRFLGVLDPRLCGHNFSHILHPDFSHRGFPINEGSTTGPFNGLPPLTNPDRTAELQLRMGLRPLDDGRTSHTVPLEVLDGRMPLEDGEFMPLDDDEFGAGMFSKTSNLFVGISRGGRVFICSDWRKALSSVAAFNEQTAIVECDSDGSTFDLGGWLSIKDHRVMFEIQDRVYVLGLSNDDRLYPGFSTRPSLAFASSLSQKLAVPISFMAIYDDCIMTSYTTLRNRTRRLLARQPYRRLGVLPTKCVRVLSFAPKTSEGSRDDMQESLTPDFGGEEGLGVAQMLSEDILGLIGRLVDDEDDAFTDMAVIGDLEDD